MKDRSLYTIIYRVCAVALSVFLLVIMVNNILFSWVNYVAKKQFAVPVVVLVFIAGVVICILWRQKKNVGWMEQNFRILPAVFLLFFYQVFVGYEILFMTNTWDVSTVMRNVYDAVTGNYIQENMIYFSQFPNNQGIFLLEYIAFKILNLFGFLTLKKGLFLFVVIQCFLSAATSYFLYDVVERHSSKKPACFAWALYGITIGLSGWQIVVYTDMLAIVFPMLTFWIYDKMDDWKYPVIAWCAMAFFSYGGFLIKPTAFIMFLAICITEVLRFLSNKDFEKETLFKTGKILFCMIVVVLVLHVAFRFLVNATSLIIDETKSTGVLHMLMMGTNNENDGAISLSDVAFSMGFDSTEERSAAQLARIKERVSAYSATDVAKLLIKKALVVFNDGSYAWGQEADFFGTSYSNGILKGFYQALYYEDGSFYFIKKYVFQILWYMMLILCGISGFLKEKKNRLPLFLALIGIIIFDMLFEARARYLLVYAPIFITVATLNFFDFKEQKYEKK